MRKGQILTLLGLRLVAGGITTAVAVLPHVAPDAGVREAGRIDFVIWLTIVIWIVIFALVGAVMVYGSSSSARRPATTRTARRSTATPGSRSAGRSSRCCS